MIGGGDGLPLASRGLIGDTATAALVAADGTIDWWCPGRFDAPATLFRLLDPVGGAVRVGPAVGMVTPPVGTQAYDPQTMVLRTRLPGIEGEVEVCDFMPWEGRGHRPAGRIVRIVTALRGPVEVEVDVVPGRAFGPADRVTPFSGGLAFDGVVVRTGFPMEGRRGSRWLDAGERLVVTVDPDERAFQPLTVDAAMDLLDRTQSAWRFHLSPLTYAGPMRSEVERSLLTIKALTYHRTGAVVAAVTTSLPERVGGERNWDYRYAWVRDASLAIDACYDAGLREESETFTGWLRTVLGEGPFPLAPVYDVEGLRLEGEDEVALAGWRRSQPVRVGNGAFEHLQLDFYADVVAGIHVEQVRAGTSVLGIWERLAELADWLCEAWKQPDRGIWEIRSEPRHLVFSKLACWYTLHRMVELARAQNPLDLDAVRWWETAKEIGAWIDEHGLGRDGALLADTSGSDDTDAALVQAVWRSPWPEGNPYVGATVDRVLSQLSSGPHIYRYRSSVDDGLPAGEGAFLACSFWVVEALARLGRWEEAHERMEQLVKVGGPLGLLPEQVDPKDGSWLGNLPQALSHLTLVQAAIALADGPR